MNRMNGMDPHTAMTLLERRRSEASSPMIENIVFHICNYHFARDCVTMCLCIFVCCDSEWRFYRRHMTSERLPWPHNVIIREIQWNWLCMGWHFIFNIRIATYYLFTFFHKTNKYLIRKCVANTNIAQYYSDVQRDQIQHQNNVSNACHCTIPIRTKTKLIISMRMCISSLTYLFMHSRMQFINIYWSIRFVHG